MTTGSCTSPARRAFRAFERWLARRGWRLRWMTSTLATRPEAELCFDLEFVLAHLALTKKDVFCVQIGANDGKSNDPLYRFITAWGWGGLLLEPIPEAFESLRATYRDFPKVKLVNAALAEQDGERPFYTVAAGSAFAKAHQFASFHRDAVASQTNWIPDIADRIVETRVRCISMATLLREAGGREIDVLQIDAEGHDFAILKMIDFACLKPAVISYEHVHMSKAEQDAAAGLLAAQGYRLSRDNLDTIAYRPIASYGWRRGTA
jgi:FkbM family methyltransferase